MDVVSVTDGKNLGKVCDVSFLFPENKIKGIIVPGSKGFKLSRADVFIPVGDIVRIGEDVVLVRFGKETPKPPKPPKEDFCPPPCPPQNRPCPPCPPQPRGYSPDPRRNFDDYE